MAKSGIFFGLAFGLVVHATSPATADCVRSMQVKGSDIAVMETNESMRIGIDGVFYPASTPLQLDPDRFYEVQWEHRPPVSFAEAWPFHEDPYLPYYDYERMQAYLAEVAPSLEEQGYKLEVIGQSLEGRDLHAIYPVRIDPAKKTIVMTGRQHGDEGTANYIIEGFVDRVFRGGASTWLDTYQLILYPMVNPDGAEAVRRYNANHRDLNRVWHEDPSREPDEVAVVHGHLRNLRPDFGDVVVVLDMHGSFNEDFIYRVPRSFRSDAFYNLQQSFIDILANHDRWQAGRFYDSVGNPRMMRIVLIESYGRNALTHETPRWIRRDNSQGRSIQTLREQGVALVETIEQFSNR